MAEWSKANDSKSFNRELFVGSNPTLSVPVKLFSLFYFLRYEIQIDYKMINFKDGFQAKAIFKKVIINLIKTIIPKRIQFQKIKYPKWWRLLIAK